MLLAFETSAKAGSVALLEDGVLLAESYQNTGLTHSQTLLTMAEELLKSCGLTPQSVEAVAVAAGPGSFTGVRIGVAAAKGFAWGGELPLYGVSTLEAMALGLPVISTDCGGGGARVLIENGVDGLLVPCGNADALAEAIRSSLADVNAMKTRGEMAKEKGKTFATENITAVWEKYICEIAWATALQKLQSSFQQIKSQENTKGCTKTTGTSKDFL